MGIKTGIVTGQSIEEYRGGDEVRMLQVQLLGQNPETVEWFDITGEDTAPVNGDKVVVWNIADNYQIAIATKDLVTAAVNAGERKFYSRDSDGNVKVTIYLKDDGTLQIDADKNLVQNITGDVIQTVDGNVVVKATKFSFGNGTDELISEAIKGFTEAKSLVGASLLGGSVDLPGAASTGTNSLITAGLSAMETALGAVVTALTNLKV